MTYPTHWGLNESPFRGCLDSKSFHQSPTHEEALARLYFLVDQQRRLGLLVGPSGSGKSLLLKVFADEIQRRGLPLAQFSLFDVEPSEMLSMLAGEWGLNPDPAQSTGKLWRSLTDKLVEYRYQKLHAVILLDDADRANPQTLQHVCRLVRFDPSPETQLTIVLSGRDEGMNRLGRSLLELADLRIDIEPWERADTGDFVKSVLSRAGRRSPIFAEPAVDRLHELSQGIPRRITQLADLALLAGAGQNLDQIDADMIEEVYQELGAGV